MTLFLATLFIYLKKSSCRSVQYYFLSDLLYSPGKFLLLRRNF